MWALGQHRRKAVLKLTALLLATCSLAAFAFLALSQAYFHARPQVVKDQPFTPLLPFDPGRLVQTRQPANNVLGQHQRGDSIPFVDKEEAASGNSATRRMSISEEYPLHEECIIYDRPTRTGSTTVSSTLQRCLKSRGYRLPTPYPKDGIAGLRMIPRMLRLNASRVGLSGVHVRISQADVDDTIEKCNKILFITSCAPMLERMWSGIKHRVGGPRARNVNTTISIDKEQVFQKMLAQQERYEDAREAYPFVDVNNRPLAMRRKLIPDYVIRREKLEQDFKPLLETLGCSMEIESRNVHTEEGESIKSSILSFPLQHNDRTYHWLSELAKNNEKGLEKARRFGSVD